MTKVLTDPQHYTSIANAIREKKGSEDTYKPSQMADAISSIPVGGEIDALSVTENGTYTASAGVDGYSPVTVNVPASAVDEGTKNISTNGTHDVVGYASASVSVPASAVDSGTKSISENGTHDVIGYASASVSVPASAVDSGTKSISTNGTHDVVGYASASVNVPTGTARTSSDVTVSGATVTVPSGLYSSQVQKSVASGTAGTPTATKGSVSNHAVSVTPSVTNTTGYITGSTKTGTAVSVSASELVSGTKSITENGTADVTNYASVDVNVSGVGAISVVDTPDSHGGTVREITAVDISPTTATASDVKTGKVFFTANGTMTIGTFEGETMTILSYGNSTWNDFITAYQSNSIVYCRASSSSNPGSGSQTRLAFMAYVSDATNPTNVEFQYYRSVSSKSATQQGDQVYVYKLTSTGVWSVEIRETYTKIATGTGLTSSYNNGVLTISLA